jgi:hypothetical protein
LGNYDRAKWLTKPYQIIQEHDKIGIGSNNFTEMEKDTIKRMLMYFNGKAKEITFAWEPIQELSEEEIKRIITENHELIGHPGIRKTYGRIRDQYKIPRLMERVENKIKHCDTCQRQKLTRIRSKEEPVITDTPLEPNDKIAMDILGPLPKTKKGHQYILSIHDELTKHPILVPLKTQQTE